MKQEKQDKKQNLSAVKEKAKTTVLDMTVAQQTSQSPSKEKGKTSHMKKNKKKNANRNA